MSLNDRLINAESIDWWQQEIKIQLNKKSCKTKKNKV